MRESPSIRALLAGRSFLRRRRWVVRGVWLAPLMAVLGGAPLALADGVAHLDALEAAYTFHFLNLIRWERPAPLLHVCVVGDSGASERMRINLGGKTANGRRIQARRIPDDSPEEGARSCDVLYLPAAYAASAPALLKRYDRDATVTISDIPGFAQEGGIIGFVVIDGRLRFDINERAAARKGLKISAKLLELARRIVR